jgi:hypothetical protein
MHKRNNWWRGEIKCSISFHPMNKESDEVERKNTKVVEVYDYGANFFSA